VVIQVEAELVAIELNRAVDIGDREDNNFKRPIR
jgi:hypothetical protein